MNENINEVLYKMKGEYRASCCNCHFQLKVKWVNVLNTSMMKARATVECSTANTLWVWVEYGLQNSLGGGWGAHYLTTNYFVR